MIWDVNTLRNIILPISFIVFLILLSWWRANVQHKRIFPSSKEAIRLPTMLAVLFSGSRSESIFDIRGILLQILVVYGLGPVLTLMYLGVISQQMAGFLIKVLVSTVLVFALVYFFIVKRR